MYDMKLNDRSEASFVCCFKLKDRVVQARSDVKEILKRVCLLLQGLQTSLCPLGLHETPRSCVVGGSEMGDVGRDDVIRDRFCYARGVSLWRVVLEDYSDQQEKYAHTRNLQNI